MKVYFCLLVGLLFNFSALSQEAEKQKLLDRHAFQMGGGINTAIVQSNFKQALDLGYNLYDFQSSPIVNGSAYVSYSLRLSKLFHLKSEFKYSSQGSLITYKEMPSSDFVISHRKRMRINMFSLPVNFSFITNNTGRIRFLASIGASVNWQYSAQNFLTISYPNYTFGIQGEVGCLFPIGESFELSISGEFADLSPNQSSLYSLRLKTFGLNTGLKYYLQGQNSQKKIDQYELRRINREDDFSHSLAIGTTVEHTEVVGRAGFIADPYGFYNYPAPKKVFRYGLSLNALYSYRINKLWSIEFGLEYLNKGVNVRYQTTPSGGYSYGYKTINLMALSHNVFFNYQPKRIGFYSKLGINVHTESFDKSDFFLAPGYLSAAGMSFKLSERLNGLLGLEYRLQKTSDKFFWLKGSYYQSIGLNTSIYFSF